MPVRYSGRSTAVKYAVSIAHGFLVASRNVARILPSSRAVRILENLGLRRLFNTPRSLWVEDQRPRPKRRVRSSATALWRAAISVASEFVASANLSFIGRPNHKPAANSPRAGSLE